ncbi:CsbD family protein [Pseudomonas sp. 5P_3.1_Bac2]|uniref:CsbD family protein n=1 Tax=Pseudomonas sp. 5P_3.1_Bac2 TaxID=2971617 RepID=UPI0021CA77A2|nr:CsbD family protein [Pseudomonas sp. 5P_3.1_Bac2]MCU1718797.1 CsbD family protein [Pseudomonas sp. 5P_3.1_Bac2]
MNADIVKGKWKQISGRIKERWGDLTDDDLNVAEGHSEYLAGKLQERYGWSKEKVQEELRDFTKDL